MSQEDAPGSEMPLFTELPRGVIPGNPPSPGPIGPGPTGPYPPCIGPATSGFYPTAERRAPVIHWSPTVCTPSCSLVANTIGGQHCPKQDHQGHQENHTKRE